MTARLRQLAARLIGRDPVMVPAVVVALLLALLPAFGWSTEVVGAVSAALVTAGGVVSAWLVSVDRALPLLVGLGKAVVAMVTSFGVHLPDNWVSALMALLTVVAGLATRPQVGAKEPARDRDGGIVAVPGAIHEFSSISDAEFDEFTQRWKRLRGRLSADHPTEHLPRVGEVPPRSAPALPQTPRQQREEEQGGRHAARTRQGGWRTQQRYPAPGLGSE